MAWLLKISWIYYQKAKVKQSYIKNAEVYEGFSFVSVPFKEAEIIVEAFAQSRKGKKPLIEKAKTKTNKY